MKIKDMVPCSLVENYRCFIGTCSLHLKERIGLAGSSEILVPFYRTTWCYSLKDSSIHICCCENLKYQEINILSCIRGRHDE
jgi:hypothetical protein